MSAHGAPTLGGQVALVTGAGSGIGLAIAAGMAAAGAAVAVTDRPDRMEGATAAARQIREAGGRSLALAADVRDEGGVAAMVAAVRERFGALDILVSNAGIQRLAPVETMTLDDWRASLEVNLTGAFLTAREAMRAFRSQAGRPRPSAAAGKILFVGSIQAEAARARWAAYGASKAGLRMLMETLALEAGGLGVRVNAIAPGATRTALSRDAWATPAALAALVRLIPRRRIGEPDDVARLAVWLASDAADYIHGATVAIDGGLRLHRESMGTPGARRRLAGLGRRVFG
jgi:glucose 1-dehydrogenase